MLFIFQRVVFVAIVVDVVKSKKLRMKKIMKLIIELFFESSLFKQRKKIDAKFQ